MGMVSRPYPPTADDEHRVPKLLNRALKQHLIILNELGFIPFSATVAHLIFQFCSAPYQEVALVRHMRGLSLDRR